MSLIQRFSSLFLFVLFLLFLWENKLNLHFDFSFDFCSLFSETRASFLLVVTGGNDERVFWWEISFCVFWKLALTFPFEFDSFDCGNVGGGLVVWSICGGFVLGISLDVSTFAKDMPEFSQGNDEGGNITLLFCWLVFVGGGVFTVVCFCCSLVLNGDCLVFSSKSVTLASDFFESGWPLWILLIILSSSSIMSSKSGLFSGFYLKDEK